MGAQEKQRAEALIGCFDLLQSVVDRSREQTNDERRSGESIERESLWKKTTLDALRAMRLLGEYCKLALEAHVDVHVVIEVAAAATHQKEVQAIVADALDAALKRARGDG